MTHVIRCEPLTLIELKNVVEDFTVNMGRLHCQHEQDSHKIVRHTKNEPSCAEINLKDILWIYWKNIQLFVMYQKSFY